MGEKRNTQVFPMPVDLQTWTRGKTVFFSLRSLFLTALWLLPFSVSPCLRGGLVFRKLQAPPQVPRSITAIGVPSFGDLLHLFRRRHLALSVGSLNSHPHAQIADRKHVGPPQRKQQKHM